MTNYHSWGVGGLSQASISVPVNSFLTNLIRSEMIKQLPIMAEAIQCIYADGVKIALLSNSFQRPNGESFLPLDQKHFDVVSPDGL